MLLNQTITDLFNFAYKFLDKFSHTYTRQILVEALALLNQLWPYLVGRYNLFHNDKTIHFEREYQQILHQ